MRRPGENAAARDQRQYRDANQRKRNICKRHGVPPGVPPSMHRLVQANHAFHIGMVRYVAFVVLGCAFVMALWATVQTHRLYAQTATVIVATGTIR
jgi:hypothetical protein